MNFISSLKNKAKGKFNAVSNIDYKKKLIPLGAVLLLMITILIVSFNWQTSIKANYRMEKVTNTDINSNTIIKSSPQGKYLGKISKSGQSERFVLFIEEYNLDTLLCTLIDYPFYNYPKEKFAMLKADGETYKSKYGSFIFKNDSLMMTSQITRDNLDVWTFTKRIN